MAASSQTTLMGLPVELREIIWSFVVAEDEPIAAYVGRRTVPRLKADRMLGMSHMIRQTKRYPSDPALLRVSKLVRSEALPLFYSKNIFTFSLGHILNDPALETPEDEVRHWQHCAFGYIPWLGRGRSRKPRLPIELWTVRVEFMMYELPDADPVDWSSEMGGEQPASLDIWFTIDERLAIKPGGVLADECICYARRQAVKIADRDHHETIATFARRVDSLWRTEWAEHARVAKAWVPCEKCGKHARPKGKQAL